MTDLQLKLRKLRNKILYNDKVPLEFGAEVLIDYNLLFNIVIEGFPAVYIGQSFVDDTEYYWGDGTVITVNKERKVSESEKGMIKQARGTQSDMAKVTEVTQAQEVLGKPVTLREVLMMLGINAHVFSMIMSVKKVVLAINTRGIKGTYVDITNIYIDLSKPIEEQDDEVLEKMIKYIEN